MIARVATLSELDNEYSITDLFDLHDAMDLNERAEEKARKDAAKGN